MPKRRTSSAKQRKNTFVDYFICIGGAAALFLMGFVEILGGRAEIGGTRQMPGREVFGEEAWTMGAAHVAAAAFSAHRYAPNLLTKRSYPSAKPFLPAEPHGR